ncbi:DNA-3-methyladenine glycosylase [Ammoniphilus sp. CFH 90114]|uniref:DNA-3-methyladenine glycosylase family protein n=1 Tax=Ammoniphilus sp. CFH 90114 TaxID=2493665 RepID=UPI00100E320D|nr:DNA-3-methyladenine glycosylase [Ammoniphilus sp. CFH 90114]RXT02807.1 DNA-3-methyladenine glycosylase 2 family protein [Ammoniphilus sp. CFH 90114]
MEDHQQELTLNLPKEFCFDHNLKYLSNAHNECLFQVQDQRIYKAIPLEQETAIIEIRATDPHTLTIRFLGNNPPKTKSARVAAARYVMDWFDLETDLQPFYELAIKDVLLQKAVDSFYGLRNIGIPDLFEAICWGIIGQQINLTFAYTLKRRLVERYGEKVEYKGKEYWIFPTPDVIAALTVGELSQLQISTKKSEYLIGVAQLIMEGKLSKESLLATRDYKQAEKLLVDIRGIGPWTANYVLMRCLRFPSAFPIDDVGLHNAIKHVLGLEHKPTKKEILQLSANWTNWESYATFYLWRFLY